MTQSLAYAVLLDGGRSCIASTTLTGTLILLVLTSMAVLTPTLRLDDCRVFVCAQTVVLLFLISLVNLILVSLQSFGSLLVSPLLLLSILLERLRISHEESIGASLSCVCLLRLLSEHFWRRISVRSSLGSLIIFSDFMLCFSGLIRLLLLLRFAVEYLVELGSAPLTVALYDQLQDHCFFAYLT